MVRSLLMADALCVPHKNRGTVVLAARVVNGMAMCADCFDGKAIETQSRFAAPSIHTRGDDTDIKPETPGPGWRGEQKPVEAKQVKEINYSAMQNDRTGGMKVAEIAKKYGCSDANVYLKTKPPAKRDGARNVAVAKPAPVRAAKPAAKANGNGHELQAALDHLQRRRDDLDAEKDNLDSLIAKLQEFLA